MIVLSLEFDLYFLIQNCDQLDAIYVKNLNSKGGPYYATIASLAWRYKNNCITWSIILIGVYIADWCTEQADCRGNYSSIQ